MEVGICWSAEQEARNADGMVVVHLQGEHVGKVGVTACGVPIGGYWHFDVEEGNPLDWQGCRRCMATIKKHGSQQIG